MKSKKLIFGYFGGEKSVLTVDNMTQDDIEEICNNLANSTKPYVVLNIHTVKNDVLLINKEQLLFLYATDIDESYRENGLKK